MGEVIHVDFTGVWYPGDGAAELEDTEKTINQETAGDQYDTEDLDLLEPLNMDPDIDFAP